MKDVELESALAGLVARGLLVRSDVEGGATYGFDDAVARKVADWMSAHPADRAGLTDEHVSGSLGQWYASAFEALADADDFDAADQAADEAQHTLQALLQAQAFDELNDFAGRLVKGTRDPELLGQVIDDFTAAGILVPFADYRLRRLLGAGTSAGVYEAERIDNALPVAVKVLRGNFTREEVDVLRFLDEAKLANRVRHPNVVEIFDAGQAGGTRFVVMELLRGRTLERRWRAKGRRLPQKRVLEISMYVLGVLAAAHEKSILHGSIRPSNIFITSDGIIKVMDFGMESLTRTMPPPRRRFPDEVDPPSFLAPEQLRGELPDPRTDLWSVGSTMLALLSGYPADPGRSISIASVLSDFHPEIASVIERALRPSRDERWPTAKQMWEAIASIHAEIGDPGEHISDPGPESAPLVETQAAGPLSERVDLHRESERPGRMPLHKPAAGEPVEAQSLPRSIPPPPSLPRSEPPPPSREVVPLPLPSQPLAGMAGAGRVIEPREAAKYLVPVTQSRLRWVPLLLIAVPVLVGALLITVLWLSVQESAVRTTGLDGEDASVRSNGTGAQMPVVTRPGCADGIRNNAETDVDCGGAQCAPCVNRKVCRASIDCKSGVCTGGVCGACTKTADCARGLTCSAGACVGYTTDTAPDDAGASSDASTSRDASASTEPNDAGDVGPVSGGTKKNGAKCGSAGECRAGFCVDGLCCENACTGTCMSCSLRSFPGKCVEIPYGSDPDKECAPKVCDGDGACGERKIDGKRCKSGRECKSGSCWRGICCNTECKGADGNCSSGKCQRSLLIE